MQMRKGVKMRHYIKKMLLGVMMFVVCGATVCSAQNSSRPATLKVGDAAPPLTIERWWGVSPTEFYKGKIFVIDFWATWCFPCKEAMPHLNQIAQKYGDKGVSTVAVNIWDTGKAKTVEEFIKQAPYKNFKFAWALDKGGRYGISNGMWMRAAGQNGIPTTFVVASNRIAWIGSPTKVEPVIKDLLNGTFDPQRAQQELVVQAQEAKLRTQYTIDYNAAVKAGDWNKAFSLYKKRRELADNLEELVRIDRGWLGALVFTKKDYPAANEFARAIGGNEYYEEPDTLQSITYQLAAIPEDKDRDGDLLLKMVARVRELKGDRASVSMFRVEASGYAALGDYATAVKAQEKFMAAVDATLKARAQQKLDEYKAKAAQKAAQ